MVSSMLTLTLFANSFRIFAKDEIKDAVLVTDGGNEIGQVFFLSKVESLKGVQHVVILSQKRNSWSSLSVIRKFFLKEMQLFL
ncbi:hypothetical protein LXL04_002030 [Taraxacum kok-saghyz]